MNSDQFFFAIFGLDSVSSRLKNKNLIQNEIFGGVACNVLGIAEGGEIEAKSFDFAPRRAKTNFYELNLQNKNE